MKSMPRLKVLLASLPLAIASGQLSSCSDTPVTAKLAPAENDAVVWEGRAISDWRWDLRAFRDVAKCNAASKALARAGKIAVPGLSLDVKDDSVFFVQVWAAEALAEIGPAAQDSLSTLEMAVKAAEEQAAPNLSRRNFAAWGHAAIVRISNRVDGHVGSIVNYLDDSDDLVRFNACRALGRLGPLAKAALPALLKAKDGDRDSLTKACAAESVTQIDRS